MNQDTACIEEVLRQGADDWVQAAELANIVIDIFLFNDFSLVKDKSLQIIAALLRQGLSIAGDLSMDGFRPWNIPIEEAIREIESRWNGLGRNPGLGEVCWLCNTPKGDKLVNENSKLSD